MMICEPLFRATIGERIFWASVIVLGVAFTTRNISRCFMKYYDYPIINKYEYKPATDPLNQYGPTKGFPKLTICLNSQHSAKVSSFIN